ncbi:MAG TPA: lipase family protein [Caulobacteraceae bacterium]|nr:lipase family protein [Caulobacteraceae bacterium]
MELPLVGRLLCVAQQAYQIQISGFVPKSPPIPTPLPSSLVGYLAILPCQVAGDNDSAIDAALVAETETEVILAFRGTEPLGGISLRTFLDWLNDINAPLVTAPGQAGSVHSGFVHALDMLWSWITAELAKLDPEKPLCITGHSKGGAMAHLAAARLAAEGRQPTVCTFEAARCGDQAFSDRYAKLVPNSVRYEFQDDIVPHLPPDALVANVLKNVPLLGLLLKQISLGYVPVGRLRFIDWDGEIVPDSPTLEAQRQKHLQQKLLGFGLGSIINDHSIAPGSGVANVLCPGVWNVAAPPQAMAFQPPPSNIHFA